MNQWLRDDVQCADAINLNIWMAANGRNPGEHHNRIYTDLWIPWRTLA